MFRLLTNRTLIAYLCVTAMLLAVGIFQSWSVAITIFNLCLISSIMALGVNIQWGYAGLFNVGIMGFAALGGLSAVLVSKAPVAEAWQTGGLGMFAAGLVLASTIGGNVWLVKHRQASSSRTLLLILLWIGGYLLMRFFYDEASESIESISPAKTGYLGGMGMPIIFSWVAGGFLAAGAAWFIGKATLGLRTDYLAIATLGISEIIIAILKNEDWLSRGVKNVTGLPRPVPYEIDLQKNTWFIDRVKSANTELLAQSSDYAATLESLVIDASSITVKLAYAGLFTLVLIIILSLAMLALNSPWGRMMRAIRDNETAASAMGKHVNFRHLQVFVIGSAIIGTAGAMLTTLDGQFTPTTYNPLRFTFLIWVMVIIGGSGNNFGAVLGSFIIWFVWIQAEPLGNLLIEGATFWMAEFNPVKLHLLNSTAYMRLIIMGLVLILVMRFNQRGILPEVNKPKQM